MGANRAIRKRELRERAIANVQESASREKALMAAIGNLRTTMLGFAEGSNWVVKHRDSFFDRWFLHKSLYSLDILWVGSGNPEELAVTTMRAVFGKDYNKKQEEK